MQNTGGVLNVMILFLTKHKYNIKFSATT